MEKKAIKHLEEIYKDEINSHDFKKAINNVDINSFNVNRNNIQEKMKLSTKNINNTSQNIPIIRNTLIFKNKLKNINLFHTKEKVDQLFTYSNSEDSQKEEEKIGNTKFKKKNNIALKICKTFKNCDENINNAKILLFNKGNKNSIKPSKKNSSKYWLSCNKRGSYLHSTKRHKKTKEKENDSPCRYNFGDYVLKKKNTIYKTSNSNKKLYFFARNNLISDFKDDKNKVYINGGCNKNSVIDLRKRAKSNQIKILLSNNKRKFSYGDKPRKETNRNSNKNNQEIVNDTDNEVENNILCILDKSFKNRNTMINGKKNKHYGTQEIDNGKYIKNLNNSLDCKNKDSIQKSNDIGKISNSGSISIIKKTELNHCNLDEELIIENGNKNKNKYDYISARRASFEFRDFDNNIMSSNKSRNKKKKKLINKMTQKDDDIHLNLDLEDKKKNNYIDDDKNNTMNNNKNIINNNLSKGGCTSFFKCCFMLE